MLLDENNIVQAVYVGINENDLTELPEGVSSWEEHYTNTQGMTCKELLIILMVININ